MASRTPNRVAPPREHHSFLSKIRSGKHPLRLRDGARIFSQGEKAAAVFYIRDGGVRLSVSSPRKKGAIIALLDPGAFVGECALTGHSLYLATGTAVGPTTVVRIPKPTMVRALHESPEFAATFMAHLLTRNFQTVEALTNQLFNSSEKRLARLLLLLAQVGRNGHTDAVIAKVSQKTSAEMVGTTRARVSFFMNKFRSLGLVEYNGEIHVHSSLYSVLMND